MSGADNIMVCERGASFGYNNLVSDMRSLAIMRETGCPVVFDATHSVQLPGGQGTTSGGQREFVPVLARAAVAVGISGLFMETHPCPEKAWSDGPNSWPLARMESLLATLLALDKAVKSRGFRGIEVSQKGYIVAEVKVHDADAMARYRALSQAAVEQYGGRFLVRGGAAEILEGQMECRRSAWSSSSSTRLIRPNAFITRPSTRRRAKCAKMLPK